MKKESAEAIKRAADSIGEECDLRPDYCGRGMYDKTTHAVVLSGVGRLCQLVALAAIDISKRPAIADTDLTGEEFAEDLAGLRADNMGRSDYVYY